MQLTAVLVFLVGQKLLEKTILEQLTAIYSGDILMDENQFPKLVSAIYEIVDKLEKMFPGRHFTPDGHMVGSIGESLASYYYGIELFPSSHKQHDGKKDDRLIQIKATQIKYISLSSEPDYLLVLRIERNGLFTEIYNGPGRQVWKSVSSKPLPKNGQYKVRLSYLQSLMRDVSINDRITQIHY